MRRRTQAASLPQPPGLRGTQAARRLCSCQARRSAAASCRAWKGGSCMGAGQRQRAQRMQRCCAGPDRQAGGGARRGALTWPCSAAGTGPHSSSLPPRSSPLRAGSAPSAPHDAGMLPASALLLRFLRQQQSAATAWGNSACVVCREAAGGTCVQEVGLRKHVGVLPQQQCPHGALTSALAAVASHSGPIPQAVVLQRWGVAVLKCRLYKRVWVNRAQAQLANYGLACTPAPRPPARLWLVTSMERSDLPGEHARERVTDGAGRAAATAPPQPQHSCSLQGTVRTRKSRQAVA